MSNMGHRSFLLLWKETTGQQVKKHLLPAASPYVTGIRNSIYLLEFLPAAKIVTLENLTVGTEKNKKVLDCLQRHLGELTCTQEFCGE